MLLVRDKKRKPNLIADPSIEFLMQDPGLVTNLTLKGGVAYPGQTSNSARWLIAGAAR